jgi:hypothetical protein
MLCVAPVMRNITHFLTVMKFVGCILISVERHCDLCETVPTALKPVSTGFHREFKLY